MRLKNGRDRRLHRPIYINNSVQPKHLFKKVIKYCTILLPLNHCVIIYMYYSTTCLAPSALIYVYVSINHAKFFLILSVRRLGNSPQRNKVQDYYTSFSIHTKKKVTEKSYNVLSRYHARKCITFISRRSLEMSTDY